MRFCRKLPVDALRQLSLQIFDLAAILTDRILKNSDRAIVKENQTVCSPILTDHILKNSDRAIVKVNQTVSK